VLSRGLVGKRKSSVFPTPIRASLLATSHADGSALNLRATGKGITRQAYGLGKKILEIDAWVRTVDCAVIEVHPEVCFATLAGRPLAHPKWSWAGAEERRRLLASAGIQVPADIGVAGESASVLDRPALRGRQRYLPSRNARAVRRRTFSCHLGMADLSSPRIRQDHNMTSRGPHSMPQPLRRRYGRAIQRRRCLPGRGEKTRTRGRVAGLVGVCRSPR
jgi:hypothetical protein